MPSYLTEDTIRKSENLAPKKEKRHRGEEKAT
jgi:hypothetical protein